MLHRVGHWTCSCSLSCARGGLASASRPGSGGMRGEPPALAAGASPPPTPRRPGPPPHSRRPFLSIPWPGRASSDAAAATGAAAAASPAAAAASPPGGDAPPAFAADDAACLADLRAAVQVAAGGNVATYQDGAAFASATGVSEAALGGVADRLGHAYTHPWLLRAALTHVSWRAESAPSGTQPLLAWIGDATLQGVVTDELITRYARSGSRPPSQLTVTRSLVLSRRGCARHARALGLDGEGAAKAMAVGASFSAIGASLSVGMLGEAFEAVMGSVYLDAGRAAMRDAFLRLAPFPETLVEVAEQYAA